MPLDKYDYSILHKSNTTFPVSQPDGVSETKLVYATNFIDGRSKNL